MTLLITVLAAVIATIIRVLLPNSRKTGLGTLVLAYWAASAMWVVDGIASLLTGGSFIELQDAAVMADDALLGICVVALGAGVWALSYVIRRAAHAHMA